MGGEIVLEDSFSALLQVERNTEAVTVHGVTRDETRKGVPEAEALERFLDYLRDGVIVGHHIGHDIATIDAACERHWGARLLNRSLDTMDLTLHLERDGAFAGRPPIRQFTLDALCTMFGVIPHDRHTATGDAFITAQVFLRLLRLASSDAAGARLRASPSRSRSNRLPLRASVPPEPEPRSSTQEHGRQRVRSPGTSTSRSTPTSGTSSWTIDAPEAASASLSVVVGSSASSASHSGLGIAMGVRAGSGARGPPPIPWPPRGRPPR